MAVGFRVFSSTEELPRALWNELTSKASPMMEWEYYHALESSGSVSPECGYTPTHLVAYDDHEPIALAPLYERDRAWVEFGDGGLLEFLTEFTGLPFHRGLLGAIPFTPVPGYEFLYAPAVDSHEACKMLLKHIDSLCESRGLLTSRIYFVSKDAQDLHNLLRESGYIILQNQYSFWFNHGYPAFEDFLQSFKSSRRTKIKRELRTVRELGIEVEMKPGRDVPDDCFGDMHELYIKTWTKHMGEGIRPFLNRSFFQSLADSFRHRTSFSVARRSNDRLGLALFYHKGKNIYGRYWGCFEEVPFLHFATCYYTPIDYAIRHGIEVMDPGFGGEHKLIRGFETVPIHHYIKFHGEEQRRIAMTVLRRIWGNLARTRYRS